MEVKNHLDHIEARLRQVIAISETLRPEARAVTVLGGPHARDRMRELAALLVERGTPSAESLAAGLAVLHDEDLRGEVAAIDLPAAVALDTLVVSEESGAAVSDLGRQVGRQVQVVLRHPCRIIGACLL